MAGERWQGWSDGEGGGEIGGGGGGRADDASEEGKGGAVKAVVMRAGGAGGEARALTGEGPSPSTRSAERGIIGEGVRRGPKGGEGGGVGGVGGGGGGNGGGEGGGGGGDVSCRQMRGLQSATSVIKGLPPIHCCPYQPEPPVSTDVKTGGLEDAHLPPARVGPLR